MAEAKQTRGVPVALDTAIYTLLQLTPADIPLWQEARRRRIPGAKPNTVHLSG